MSDTETPVENLRDILSADGIPIIDIPLGTIMHRVVAVGNSAPEQCRLERISHSNDGITALVGGRWVKPADIAANYFCSRAAAARVMATRAADHAIAVMRSAAEISAIEGGAR